MHVHIVNMVSSKLHPDRLAMELFGRFSRLLQQARNILVIGYSWADPHVNDMLLESLGDGAILVDISKSAPNERALAILAHRFPTTFAAIAERVFLFGGGAEKILSKRIIELPGGDFRSLDLIQALQKGLPRELSMQQMLPCIIN